MQTNPLVRPLTPRIVADSCAGLWGAASFYNYPILGRPERDAPMEVSLAIWRDRAKWLDQNRFKHLHADRDELIRVIEQQMQRWGSISASMRIALDQARSPDCLFVLGGQQCNLFAGPMLIVYKVISTIRTAKQATKRLGRPVLPVFWLASEDHDWDEVNHLYVANANHAPQKIGFTDRPDLIPVSEIGRSDDQWKELLEQILQVLPTTDFTAESMEMLRTAVKGAISITDACAKLLMFWFKEERLIVFDAHDPNVRTLEKPMFNELMDRNEQLRQSLLENEKKLHKHGFQSGVMWEEKCTHLFIVHRGRRRLLFADGVDGVTDKRKEVQFSWDALKVQLAENPETFSNNVLSRPIMQEFLFPTLSVILGPSELAYWSVLNPALELFGMHEPPLISRRAYQIIEGPVERMFEKHGVSPEYLLEDGERRKQVWIDDHSDIIVQTAIELWQKEIKMAYLRLERQVKNRLPELLTHIQANEEKVSEQMNYLVRKLDQNQRQILESGIRQWERMLNAIVPNGKPQERVYHPISYINKYGVEWFQGWIRSLIEEDIQ